MASNKITVLSAKPNSDKGVTKNIPSTTHDSVRRAQKARQNADARAKAAKSRQSSDTSRSNDDLQSYALEGQKRATQRAKQELSFRIQQVDLAKQLADIRENTVAYQSMNAVFKAYPSVKLVDANGNKIIKADGTELKRMAAAIREARNSLPKDVKSRSQKAVNFGIDAAVKTLNQAYAQLKQPSSPTLPNKASVMLEPEQSIVKTISPANMPRNIVKAISQ